MALQKQKILLDCERMKYPNTGLYHFCLQLGTALQALLAQNSMQQLYCYTSTQTAGFINKNISLIRPKFWHKWYLSLANDFGIWHVTHQSTDYFPTSSKTPVVLTIHDLNFLYNVTKSTKKKQRYLQALQQKINHSKQIVAISEHVKSDILKHCDVKNKTLSVIYNGCNINNTIMPKKPVNIGLQPFLYTIGTILEKKNFHVLPALLVHNNYTLIISGITQSQAYKHKIIAEAIQYGVADRVVFTGSITEAEKYWYLQHCKAFVFPSLAEGFGLPIIEAMHFGKPVILSTHTSLPEVGGKHAYYFSNFDAASMQQTLINSLAHYHQKNPQDLIKAWANTFTWQKAAEQYIAIYTKLLTK